MTDEFEYMPEVYFILDKDCNLILDRNGMNIIRISDYKLLDTEKEIATQLIRDGWQGDFDSLLLAVKELAK